MAESNPKTSPRSKSTKVNFVLLKQILEDQSSEFTDKEVQGTISVENETNQDDESVEKAKKVKKNVGPTGQYPVLFSKRCKSRSCQTRLSAFPLFSLPEDTEWISDGEDTHKVKRKLNKPDEKKEQRREMDSRCLNTAKIKQNEMEKEKSLKRKEITKSQDDKRKKFSSEHQLKDTKNPLLQAWLHQKNVLARKIRKQERKIKQAQRAALEEEERLKNERFEESDKKVREWFKNKKREARKQWRKNHPKVSPFQMVSDETNITSPSSPEHKVIKSLKFKRQQSSSGVTSLKSGSSSGSAEVHACNKTTRKSVKSKSEDLNPTNDTEGYKIITGNNKTDSCEAQETPKPKRPKTTQSQNPARKNAARPKTAGSSPSTKPKTIYNEKLHINKSTENINSLKYEEWLKVKREQERKSITEKRRELIDSHLDAVIAKLGKQRVEKIMTPRKQVDTGLKNYNRSAGKSLILKKNSYKWVPEHDAPRPEPQGCDCPDVDHIDGKVSLVACDNMSSDASRQGQCKLVSQKQATNFCKEVTDKCEDLKPSLEKFVAVLDSEIQKCTQDKMKNKIMSTYKAPSGISTTNATIRNLDNEIKSSSEMNTMNIPGTVESSSYTLDGSENTVLSAGTKSPHPNSTQPKQPLLVANTSLTAEAKKKIFHDMDVLGLCADPVEFVDDNANHTIGDIDSQSTVRGNYFDYGTDVDIPSMEKLE